MSLKTEQKVEMLRLFLDSAKLAHLQVALVYEITDFKITGANDETIIVPTDYETLTLTTCYPFEYIDDAPDRFIVYTKLVSKPDLEK